MLLLTADGSGEPLADGGPDALVATGGSRCGVEARRDPDPPAPAATRAKPQANRHLAAPERAVASFRRRWGTADRPDRPGPRRASEEPQHVRALHRSSPPSRRPG